MVTVRAPNLTLDHPFAQHYPLRLEYELRKNLFAGETERTLLSAERFLAQLELFSGEELATLKSSVMQAIIVLYHKSLQVGVHVEQPISRIIFVARRIDDIETWEGIKQLFTGVVRQILEKTNLQSAEEEVSLKIRSYIQAHFHKHVTLGELAEAMRMEPMQLSRMFARKMGLDFRDYLAQTRVREARKLLLNTGLSVAEIASMVGYRDVAYFIRVFKRLVGTTPRQFAKQKSLPPLAHPGLMPDMLELCAVEVPPEWQSGRVGNVYPWLAERNLSTALMGGDIEETRQKTDELFGDLTKLVKETNALKSYVIKLAVVLARKCLQNRIPVEGFLLGTLERCRLVDGLETQAEVGAFLHEATQELCQCVILQKNETIRAVESLKFYIYNNYSQPIKLGELADLVSYSPCYLVRVFNRLTGTTPHEYLINRRIEVASELVLRRELSLEAIAALVGYQDTSHFVHTFKKRFGQTPKEYAERHATIAH